MPRKPIMIRDEGGAPIPVLKPGQTIRQALTTTAVPISVASFTNVTEGMAVIRIVTSDAGVHVRLDGTANANSMFVPANTPIEIKVKFNDTISLFPSANPTTVFLTVLY